MEYELAKSWFISQWDLSELHIPYQTLSSLRGFGYVFSDWYGLFPTNFDLETKRNTPSRVDLIEHFFDEIYVICEKMFVKILTKNVHL